MLNFAVLHSLKRRSLPRSPSTLLTGHQRWPIRQIRICSGMEAPIRTSGPREYSELLARPAVEGSIPGFLENGLQSWTSTQPPSGRRLARLRLASTARSHPRDPSSVSRVLVRSPGCALTDEELELLRRIAAANAPLMFQAEGRTVPAHLAFDHRVDVLRDLRKAGWLVLEVWVAEPGNRGHARRRYSAAQAYCTESGREALEMIGD